MPSSWGDSWGSAWGDSWGQVSTTYTAFDGSIAFNSLLLFNVNNMPALDADPELSQSLSATIVYNDSLLATTDIMASLDATDELLDTLSASLTLEIE